MRERAEGRDERTGRITRDDKQDERREARRDEMKKRNELPPTCELAYLRTCLLANLPAILTMLSRLPFCSCSCRSLVSSRHSVPSSRILVPSGDTRIGTVFLIRPSHPPDPYPSCHAPFSSAHSFRHLVMPSRPIVSSGVCNEIFCYLTFHMLNTKK